MTVMNAVSTRYSIWRSAALSEHLLEGLQYLAICAPGPIPLSFIRHLTKNENIDEVLEQLHTYNWCQRREGTEQRHYELHQLVRELFFERFGRLYIEVFITTVDTIFLDEKIHFTVKDALIGQLNEALVRAKEIKDQRMKSWLYSLYYYCTFRGHFSVYIQLTEIIEQTFIDDKTILSAAFGNRALILKT